MIFNLILQLIYCDEYLENLVVLPLLHFRFKNSDYIIYLQALHI